MYGFSLAWLQKRGIIDHCWDYWKIIRRKSITSRTQPYFFTSNSIFFEKIVHSRIFLSFQSFFSQGVIARLSLQANFADTANKKLHGIKFHGTVDASGNIWYYSPMGIYVSHESALEYWRLRFDACDINALRRSAVLPNSPPDMGLLETGNIGDLSFPLHILLGHANARRMSKAVKQHVFTARIPVDCFVKAGKGLMVSAPEFCFLQMAKELPLIKLIVLGYELCGTYSLPAVITSKESIRQQRGFNTRPPLASKKKLETFLACTPGVAGHKNAARALRYIADGAASPMEAKLAILLTMSFKLGGFNFPLPELNSRIIPVKMAKQSSDKTYYCCDLYWPDFGLAVEYDSDFYHTGPERIAGDSKRRNALASMGVKVVTVTNRQIHSVSELEKVARILAGHMGRRLRLPNPDFAVAQRELISQ